MRPPLRRALSSALVAALVACGIAFARWTAADGDYPARAIDVRDEVDGSTWTLYAIEYARSDGVALDQLVRGGDPAETVDMSWYFWLALGHGRAVLIDTGTDLFARQPEGRSARRWSIARSRTVPDALAAVGMASEDISDVVLTHRHWDHVGALVRFEDAQVHVHAAEWSSLHIPMGNVETFDGTPAYPAPQMIVHEAGRHTAHHCVVELECGDGPVVIGGDGAYLFHNLEAAVPISVTLSDELNVSEMRALGERVGEGRVLPGHDPEVFERFDSPREGIARICR